MTVRSLAAVLIAAAFAGCVFDFGSFTRTKPLVESVVLGRSGPKIAMLDVQGLISEASSSSVLGFERPSLVARLREALDLARDDDDVAALLLRVRSPGGTVSASETLYHEVLTWKRETGRPVLAYLQGIAASGGYYVAMSADEVISHPTSITGSIGVIMSGINLSGLMERVGVADQTITSGAFKDAGSPLRSMRPEERRHFESVVEDLHLRFREVVAQGRPKLAEVDGVSDGRIFTARQALELGLIDGIGHLDEAVAALEARAGLAESRLVVYQRPGEYLNNIYSLPPGPPAQAIDIDVLSLEPGRLEPGFYYLWPPALASE